MALPIVGVPGIGSDHTMYDAMVGSFTTRHEFIGWNLPGYGDSEPVEHYSFPDLVRRLAADLDRRGLGRVHILGHSIGGMVAMEFGLAYPDRTASLMLSGTTVVFGSRDGTFQAQFLADRLSPLDDGMTMADLARQFMPNLTGPQITKPLLDEAIEGMARIAPDAYRAAMRCLVTFNRRKEVEGLTCPVLLLAGDLDTNAPLKTMQRMSEFIPNSQLHVFANTGHMAPFEVPAEFAGAIEAFLSQEF